MSIRQNRENKELEFDQKLYDEGVISRREWEDRLNTTQNLETQRQILIENQSRQWESELRLQERQLAELQAEAGRFQKEAKQYIITAPISGTIHQLTGKYEGSLLTAGESLATISPDNGIQAICYIAPKDIGYLQEGMPVKIQVYAFNYNEWGLVTGTVDEIASDITLHENQQPYFLVKCTLDKNYLETKAGFKGQLKKGMTLQARFVLTQRSLFQLLYDKTDKWLNPNLNEKSP